MPADVQHVDRTVCYRYVERQGSGLDFGVLNRKFSNVYHPIDVTDSSDLRNWERVTPTAILHKVGERRGEKIKGFFVVTGSVCYSDGSQVNGDCDNAVKIS